MLKWRFERSSSMKGARAALPTTVTGSQSSYNYEALSVNMATDGKLTDYGFLEPRGRPSRQLQKAENPQTHSHPQGFSKHQPLEPTRAFQDISNTQRRGPSSPRYAVRRTLERSVSCVSPDKFHKPFLPEPQQCTANGSVSSMPKSYVYELARQLVQRTQSYTHNGEMRQQNPLGNIAQHSPLRVSNQPQTKSGNFRRNQFPYSSASVIPTSSYQCHKDPRRQPLIWNQHIPEDFAFINQWQQSKFPIYSDKGCEGVSEKTPGGLQHEVKEPVEDCEDSGVCSKHSTAPTSSTDSVQSVMAKISEPSHERDYMYYDSGTLSKSHNVKSEFLMGKGILKLSVYLNYGMLTIDVIQARHLQSISRGTCNTRVKISLVPDDTGRTKCSTSVARDTNHPLFEEKFSFELLPGDIKKRLLVSVWNYSEGSQYTEFLGCMTFGVESIFSAKREVDGWYYLLKEDVGRKKHLKAIVKKFNEPYEPERQLASPPTGSERRYIAPRTGSELGHVIRKCVSQHLLNEIADEPCELTREIKEPAMQPSLLNRSVSLRNIPLASPTRHIRRLERDPILNRRDKVVERAPFLNRRGKDDIVMPRKDRRRQEENVYLVPKCCENNMCDRKSCVGDVDRLRPLPKSLSAGHMRDSTTTRVTRSLSAMNLSNHRRADTPIKSYVGQDDSGKSCSLKQDSFFSIPTPKALARKLTAIRAPRIVYVDKTKGLSNINQTPSTSPSSIHSRAVDDLCKTTKHEVSPGLVLQEQAESDIDNTYESLHFLDQPSYKKESKKGKTVCSKRKRDAPNESNLSNTSVKHPTKRRKTTNKDCDTANDSVLNSSKVYKDSSVPLPFSRGWRLRDSLRRAIFGKKRSRKFLL